MKNEKTFAIYTLGCKLNYSESSDIARRLAESGFTQSENPAAIIVNSCAVTASAEKKVRNLVTRLHRENPASSIILIGCMSALKPDELLNWQGVAAVFGSSDKLRVISYLTQMKVTEQNSFFSTYSSQDRTRSFLKIQDGCDYYCTYCTVARARGKSRSDTIGNVIDNIKMIARMGIKEINLTGVNIGDFGCETGGDFSQLIKAIEADAPNVRIRISSIEPNLLKDDIIETVSASKILMPHFHIPLQSGSDRILTAMGRRYNRQLFADKIKFIKQLIPDACVAIDLISGFPGESEEDFRASFDFIAALPVSYLHVFTYSKRAGTPAATFSNQVPEPVKRIRTNQYLSLSQSKLKEFYMQHINKVHPVLFESDKKLGYILGFTDNYIKIKMPYRQDWINQVVDIELTEDNLCFE